jgi:prepilin-type N-terminal cleavage/methylation domain-containing protein
MRLISRPSHRAGFTLIELMTVIGIIAIMVALVAGGIGRVRTNQQTSAAEQTVNKIQIALEQQWKAVLDQCKQDRLKNTQNFSKVVTFCGDADRAESLWTYLNLKREFPQTFAEATSPITLIDPVSGNQVTLAARQTFASAASPSGLSAANEAAVLLYLNLSEKGNRGMNFMADDVTTGAQGKVGNFRVFADPWGTPITFLRFANFSPELQNPPFTTTNVADMLDPLGKLANATTPAWPGAASQAVALKVINQGGASPAVAFGQNKIITVISFGPNQSFENDPLGTAGAGTDDLYGYRLRKLGQKSN